MSKTLISIVIVIAILVVGSLWYVSKDSNTGVVAASSSSVATTQDAGTQIASSTTPQNINSSTSTAGTTDVNQKYMNATLHTNQGDITFQFNPTIAPNAVANFIKLAGSNFYDGVKFHRVIKGFMIQGGDPLTKDDSQKALWGTGGPGYKFDDEITPDSKNDLGTVAMANSGPNTNGSQFYINVANNNFLDGKYVVFAKVTSGMDVVMAISNMPTNSSDQPVTPVVINSITLN